MLLFLFWAVLGATVTCWAVVSAAATSQYPVAIKNVVSKLTQSCQRALEGRCSRIEVELPPAVDWGVEIKKGSTSMGPQGGGNLEKMKKSNREAARLFTEMFAALQTTTVVMFPTELEAMEARGAWTQFRGQCLSFESPTKSAKGFSKLRSRRFTAEEQEAVLMGSDGVYVPDGCEVLILAGPRAKDYKALKKLGDKLGQGTAMINLNGRFESVKQQGAGGSEGGLAAAIEWYDDEFTNVFNYCPPALSKPASASTSTSTSTEADKRELLLYHEYNSKWLLGEKVSKKDGGFIGAVKSLTENPFKTLAEWDTKPSVQQIESTLSLSLSMAAPPSSNGSL